MLKKFLDGFVFGIGIFAAFAVGGYILSEYYSAEQVLSSDRSDRVIAWNDLDIDGKLEQASAIYVIRYRAKEEGLMEAYIDEIYVKDSAIEVGAKKGDVLKKSNFYSRGGNSRDRDGAVRFLIGSPAKERSTLFLYDDRLAGGSDMPIDLVIKKFKADGKG